MVATVLVDACGRCGTPGPGAVCGRCACPTVPARSEAVHPLSDTVPAGRTPVGLAVLVDALGVVAPAVVLWAVLAADPVTRRSGAATGLAVAVALALLVATAAAVLGTGRALGGLLVGLRVVDARSGQPVRAGRLARRLAGGARPGLVWCAVRIGRDPARTGLVGPADGAEARDRTDDVGYPVAYTRRASAVSLRLGDGRLARVEDALVVGRNPDPEAGTPGRPCAVLVWPDLSRRLARSHVLLEREGWALWVTDLSGATTHVAADGTPTVLETGRRTRVEVGDVLRVGGRTLTVLGTAA